MGDAANGLCEMLEWDSDFFARRIGRLSGRKLTPDVIARATEWATARAVECLYFLADPADACTLHSAFVEGFELTDIRIALERSTITDGQNWSTSAARVRPAVIDDIPVLRMLAATNHRDSRFYYDRHFAHDHCDELFSTWIERSSRGYADEVLVSTLGDSITGYVTLHLKESDRGSIGLLGVSSAARASGAGSSLIGAATHWLNERGVPNVDVVTQGRNVRALRFYQRSGFSVVDVGLWYHWWLPSERRSQ